MYGLARTSPVHHNKTTTKMALYDFTSENAVPNNPSSPTFDADLSLSLDNLTLQQLLTLRNAVEQRLPVKNLREINLARELVLQLQANQELQNRCLANAETPANQVAQTMNSTAAVLQQLIRLQTEVHNSERLKKIEQKLIEALNTLPAETQEAFLETYELMLAED